MTNWKCINSRRVEIVAGVIAAWASIWIIFFSHFGVPGLAATVLATLPVSAFVAGAGAVRLVGWMLKVDRPVQKL